MVSKSPAWRQIAEELELGGRPGKSSRTKQRIGMDIAEEERSVASSETPHDLAVRYETMRMTKDAKRPPEADETIDKLEQGSNSDDQARELARLVAEQKKDSRARKTRQDL